MPLPNFITKIFAGGASELVDKVGGLVDNLTMSKEEKEQFKIDLLKAQNEHEAKMAGLAQAELDAQLKDIQGARDANVKIQESDKASWLSKNFAYLMDSAIIITFVTMLVMIVYKVVPQENKELFYSAFGMLGAKFITIIDFHRGSSVGSKANGDTLRKIIENK